MRSRGILIVFGWLVASCGAHVTTRDVLPAPEFANGTPVPQHYAQLFQPENRWTFRSGPYRVDCRVKHVRVFDAGIASELVCDDDNGGIDGIWAAGSEGLWRNLPNSYDFHDATLDELTEHPMLMAAEPTVELDFETFYGCIDSILQDERGWCIEETCGESSFAYCFDGGISHLSDSETELSLSRDP